MLEVHRSERADLLVEALGDLLVEPLADPMMPEVVSVPTRGVERWLTQRLSHRLGAPEGEEGVCANVMFPFPGVLVTEAVAAACGVDAATDPWLPQRSVWPLIELIDLHLDDPELRLLGSHLRACTPEDIRGRPGSLRRFGVARRLADLFDHYAVHRPEVVAAWAQGTGGLGELPDSCASTAEWQSHLWRLLRQRIGLPSPPERLAEATRRLATEPGLLGLPERLSVFGLTRLPPSHLDVLQAIAKGRDVHLFLLHPSGELWDRVAASLPVTPLLLPRRQDPTAGLPRNPLLRSWGRDAREMQLVLASRGISCADHRRVEAVTSGATLLRMIQDGIRADRCPPGEPGRGETDQRPELDPADRSLQVHACHGRTRQVEVVRDALAHLLQADESLEARDVIVMSPDVETFAPLVRAAFRSDSSQEQGAGGLPALRVRLADRSVRQTNPLLGVAARLLELADSRLSAPEVLDLASCTPVARRFRLHQEDIATAQRWIEETGVRWGLDAEHRRPWALEELDANTWSAGLDRLMLGVAMAEEDGRTYCGTLPYGDVPSSDVELAGRLAELIERLRSALDSLSGLKSPSEWVGALATATEQLAESEPSALWQHEQLRRVLEEIVIEASSLGGTDESGFRDRGPRDAGPALCLAEVRDLLGSRLKGRPTRANFRTGDLTVCTLVPMRSVPHRVVALLGLDDGAFPRDPATDGDDLLSADPRIGERDPRTEDRQLLLDALLAATEHLIISYSGADERTGLPRPPCVAIAELLDTVDATARPSAGQGALAREQVLVHHPLQPFDPRNFTPGGIAGKGPWSYDQVQLRGALASASRAQVEPADQAAVWLQSPLPPLEEPVLELEELARFVKHPLKAFLRRRFDLYLTRRAAGVPDSIPLDLDSLQRWGVGERLLEAALSGVERDLALQGERARGLIPPGSLGDELLEQVQVEVDELVSMLERAGFERGPTDSVEVHLDLPGGKRLLGTVAGRRGSWVASCSYSRLTPARRLSAWVRFLALSAAQPESATVFLSLGRDPAYSGSHRTSRPLACRLGPLGEDAAHRKSLATEMLAAVADLYERGMCEPIPLPIASAHAYAQALRDGCTSEQALGRAAESWKGDRGEVKEAEQRLVRGIDASFRSLTAEPPAPDEKGHAWPQGRSRFEVLARRLWSPLLDNEELLR